MTLIVADTTCGLPRDLLAKRGIPLIPQVVMFGEQSYHDDKELDTAAFLQKLKASATLPKTAAPEPTLYYPIFEGAQAKGESVVVIAPSAKVSGTVRSAETAAQEFRPGCARDRHAHHLLQPGRAGTPGGGGGRIMPQGARVASGGDAGRG